MEGRSKIRKKYLCKKIIIDNHENSKDFKNT